MEPTQYTLGKPEDIHQFFRVYRCHPPIGWWFRGQADASWDVLPKAGRPEYRLPDAGVLGRFRDWSTHAVAYLRDLPANDWERLAVAQHYGLATPLLDWTQNPLVAVYFACRELPRSDAAVYCYMPAVFIDEKILDLMQTKCNGAGFIPRAISPRILNQRAVFTVHLPVTQAIVVGENPALAGEPNLARLHIPAALKDELLTMLNDYGINHVTLFPDLAGFSTHVNWETARIAHANKLKPRT